MKLSTLVLTTVLTLSTATAAQARPIRINSSWGNVLQHQVRQHQLNHRQHQVRQHHLNHRQHQARQHHQQQVNHSNHRQQHQARQLHRPTHRSAYPYYGSQVGY